MVGPWDYTTGIPAANNNPSVDQPNMQQNTNSISNLILVDHLGFNVLNGGYHKVIHFNDQGTTTPGVVPGVGQLYTNTVSGDQQLFYESGSGLVSQLTPSGKAFSIISSTNGYVYVLGNILIQWGQVAVPIVTPISYNIDFPSGNPPFYIGLTAQRPLDGFPVGLSPTIIPTYQKFTSVNNPTVAGGKLYWLAIGN